MPEKIEIIANDINGPGILTVTQSGNGVVMLDFASDISPDVKFGFALRRGEPKALAIALLGGTP